jgi:hypothetical protein
MSRQRNQSILSTAFPTADHLSLNDEQLTSYLSDLFAEGTRVSIRVKDSAQSCYRAVSRLAELHELMLNKHIWGAELAYDHQGVQWADLLTIEPHGFHLEHTRARAALTA